MLFSSSRLLVAAAGLSLLLTASAASVPRLQTVGLAAAADCTTPTEADGIRLRVEPRPDNALIVDAVVALDSPAPIVLEYGSAATGWLRTPVTQTDVSHRVPLLRLRAETSYEAQAFSVDEAGCLSLVATAAFHTTALPPEVGRFQSTATGHTTFPMALMDLRGQSEETRILAAVDADGQFVWYYSALKDWPEGPDGGRQLVVVQRPNFNLALMNGYDGVYELSPDGRLVQSVQFTQAAASHIHHDMIQLPDGRLMFIAAEDRSPPSNCEGIPDLTIRGDTLHVLDLDNGTEQQVWSAFDYLDPVLDCQRGFLDNKIDDVPEWLHTNSVSVGPRGNIIISSRRTDQVTSIAPDLQSIEWRLGGPQSNFTFEADAQFYGQHTAFEVADGRVLLFDNGRRRPDRGDSGSDEPFSRGLELQLDFATMRARKVWEFRSQPDVYADRVSSVQRLDNGNTLVNFGFRSDDPAAPLVLVESDSDGTAIWEQLVTATSGRSRRYRALAIYSLAGEHSVEPTAFHRVSAQH